jgi:nitric oxide reductase large subunit
MAYYDSEETDQREEAKEKEAWKVAIVAVVGFILLGALIWGFNLGSKY